MNYAQKTGIAAALLLIMVVGAGCSSGCNPADIAAFARPDKVDVTAADYVLQPPDEMGRWVDEFGKNSMSFDTDEAGSVTAMIIDSRTKFRR